MRTREEYKSKIYNRIDIVYWILDRYIFNILFKPPKGNKAGEYEKLEASEEDFLVENMGKHRLIIWLNIFLASFLYFYGLDLIGQDKNNLSMVVTGLLAPAMITGAAWFAISFGGIPEKFIGAAYWLTFAMLVSFTFSMTLLTSLLIYVAPPTIGAFILAPIYLALYLASAWYDSIDGLKVGLDSTMLKFSRANLNYFQKHGLITNDEIHKETFVEGSVTSNQIALFSYYLKMLDRNLEQLEEKKGLQVANHLIISSTDLLLNIFNLFYSMNKILDLGDDYKKYIISGYKKEQDYVDTNTILYLSKIIVEYKNNLSSDEVKGELELILRNLEDFEKANQASESNEDDTKQEVADYMLSQTFSQLAELLSAYRHILFEGTKK